MFSGNINPPQVKNEAQSIYLSACATVQQQYKQSRPPSPKVTLVLGADRNGVLLTKNEVRLRKWDPYLFAQGVIILAFDELMPAQEKLAMARRAVNWAGATVSLQQLQK